MIYIYTSALALKWHSNEAAEAMANRSQVQTQSLLLPVKDQSLLPARPFPGSPKMHSALSPQANGFYARLPGCVSPTLLSPSARAPPMSPKSPTSPISPGKRIRRNAAVLGIPLDLRRGQASLPLPVRNILGDIICPMDLQGIYLDTSEQPTYVMSMTSAGADTGRAAVVATTATTGTTGRAAPLRKVVRGGA